MNKKDLFQSDDEGLKTDFLLGAILYDELTEERTKTISKEQAKTLTDKEIEAIFLYSFIEDLTFEENSIATDSIANCADVLVERHPPEEPVEESLRKFKEKYGI